MYAENTNTVAPNLLEPMTLKELLRGVSQATQMRMYEKWLFLTYGKTRREGEQVSTQWYRHLEKPYTKLQPNEIETMAEVIGVDVKALSWDFVFGVCYRERKGLNYFERLMVHSEIPNKYYNEAAQAE